MDQVLNIGQPKLITNDDLFAAALRLILDGTPNWVPHDGDVLTIHCTTSYVLSPYAVRAFVTGPKIEAARLIGKECGDQNEISTPGSSDAEQRHMDGPKSRGLKERIRLLKNILGAVKVRIGLIGPDEPRTEDGQPDWHVELEAIDAALEE